jgi:hypothetical protein
MMDIIIWMIAITVIVLSIISKDTFPAVLAFCCFLVVAISVFTYQIIFGEKVPDTYYGYLSFNHFVAVIAVMLFAVSRLLKIEELADMGMKTLGFWLIIMSTIMLAHQYWGFNRISYFHLVLLSAGIMFYVAEHWQNINVFKVLAVILANISFFYLAYSASQLEGGINYANLTQAVLMYSGLSATCIVFFAYYLLAHKVISEKHANRFLGLGVSLMAAGTVYLHPEASAVAFKPFHGLKGLLAVGDVGAMAYGVGLSVFAKTRLV